MALPSYQFDDPSNDLLRRQRSLDAQKMITPHGRGIAAGDQSRSMFVGNAAPPLIGAPPDLLGGLNPNLGITSVNGLVGGANAFGAVPSHQAPGVAPSTVGGFKNDPMMPKPVSAMTSVPFTPKPTPPETNPNIIGMQSDVRDIGNRMNIVARINQGVSPPSLSISPEDRQKLGTNKFNYIDQNPLVGANEDERATIAGVTGRPDLLSSRAIQHVGDQNPFRGQDIYEVQQKALGGDAGAKAEYDRRVTAMRGGILNRGGEGNPILNRVLERERAFGSEQANKASAEQQARMAQIAADAMANKIKLQNESKAKSPEEVTSITNRNNAMADYYRTRNQNIDTVDSLGRMAVNVQNIINAKETPKPDKERWASILNDIQGRIERLNVTNQSPTSVAHTSPLAQPGQATLVPPRTYGGGNEPTDIASVKAQIKQQAMAYVQNHPGVTPEQAVSIVRQQLGL